MKTEPREFNKGAVQALSEVKFLFALISAHIGVMTSQKEGLEIQKLLTRLIEPLIRKYQDSDNTDDRGVRNDVYQPVTR